MGDFTTNMQTRSWHSIALIELVHVRATVPIRGELINAVARRFTDYYDHLHCLGDINTEIKERGRRIAKSYRKFNANIGAIE